MSESPERLLCLVKHAMPEIDLSVPPMNWHLSSEGHQGAERLAPRLTNEIGINTSTIYSSPEPKAQETAANIGKVLNCAVVTHPALHEHLRPLAPEQEQVDFQTCVARLFAEPAAIVYGSESANQAYDRFGMAVDEICANQPGDVLIVAHGTVISLLAARRCGTDGHALWRRLGLPSAVSIHLPAYRIARIIENSG